MFALRLECLLSHVVVNRQLTLVTFSERDDGRTSRDTRSVHNRSRLGFNLAVSMRFDEYTILRYIVMNCVDASH